MDFLKLPFTVGNMEYILWAWRGDYLNLGAGAEVGIYSRPKWMAQDPEKLDHYNADYDLAMPMTLYLYNYEDEDNITNLVSWEPETDQWWILAFNLYYSSTDINTENDIDVDKQVMICSIDFSTDIAKYEALKRSMNKLENSEIRKNIIFDDYNYTTWICWYERGVIQ